MADRYIDIDRFAKAVSDIVEDAEKRVEDRVPTAVSGACKAGRKAVRANAAAAFKGTGAYAKGFGYKVGKRSNRECVGEIGNKDLPGLVHLLEKGHAKMGGGRVAGREHVAPAADEAFGEFERLMDDVVEEAL